MGDTLGLLLGVLFGFILEYGNFNLAEAFRSILFAARRTDLRVYIVAVALSMPVVNLLETLRLIRVERVPFFWPAILVGAFIFGIGMALGAGCTNVWHGAGRGAPGSAAGLVGFVVGVYLVRVPPFRHYFDLLRNHLITVRGHTATLYNLVGLPGRFGRWTVVAVLVSAAAVWLLREHHLAPHDTPRWLAIGVGLGTVIILGWAVSGITGYDYGLSITRPTLALGLIAFSDDVKATYWGVFMLAGFPLGVLLAARIQGTLSFRVPSLSVFARLVGAGTVAGFGASLAGGCNVGHDLTGVAVLSASSTAAMLTAMCAVWIVTAVQRRVAAARPVN